MRHYKAIKPARESSICFVLSVWRAFFLRRVLCPAFFLISYFIPDVFSFDIFIRRFFRASRFRPAFFAFWKDGETNNRQKEVKNRLEIEADIVVFYARSNLCLWEI